MPLGRRAVEMLVVALALLTLPARAQDLRGHGGPVRAMAMLPAGDALATASFDSTVILWSLGDGRARQVLRFHEGVVHAVAVLTDGRVASAGEDARIAIWQPGSTQPAAVLEGHRGPVVALVAAPDGRRLASAAWDGSVRLWSLDGGAPEVLDHQGVNVNGVGFLGDGRLVSGAYDGTVRLFAADGRALTVASTGAPISMLMVISGDEIVAAGADGQLRFYDSGLQPTGRLVVAEAPLVAVAATRDGRLLAAAGFRGALAVIDRRERRIVRRMEGPAFPLWSLAFTTDGEEILTGGSDRLVRRWRVATGEPVSPVLAGPDDGIPAALRTHPGAEVFRACQACHSLSGRDEARAGPTLAGLYGRRIGTAGGYDFSPALRAMDIIWSPETLQKLFEIGPAAYTPGTKMPEQKLINGEDRKALAEFLGLADKR